jgi:Pyruvate/2-oxoglutarate dehydrogenase complex, dehydrogenase (E1) component, eukaryotic type, beta subunit
MSGGQLTVPVVFRTQGGAGWSPVRSTPSSSRRGSSTSRGSRWCSPRRRKTCAGLLWSAIYDDNPVVFFEHRTLYPIKGDVPQEIEPIPIGRARVSTARART